MEKIIEVKIANGNNLITIVGEANTLAGIFQREIDKRKKGFEGKKGNIAVNVYRTFTDCFIKIANDRPEKCTPFMFNKIKDYVRRFV